MFAFAILLLLLFLLRLYRKIVPSASTLLACPICLAVYRFTFVDVRCGHNVIHQNSPFSSLRAASFSVAGLNMDDNTFSMSSNVIIFGQPRPLALLSPTRNASNMANCGSVGPSRSWSSAVLHPSSLLLHPCRECGVSAIYRPPSTVLRLPSFVFRLSSSRLFGWTRRGHNHPTRASLLMGRTRASALFNPPQPCTQKDHR